MSVIKKISNKANSLKLKKPKIKKIGVSAFAAVHSQEFAMFYCLKTKELKYEFAHYKTHRKSSEYKKFIKKMIAITEPYKEGTQRMLKAAMTFERQVLHIIKLKQNGKDEDIDKSFLDRFKNDIELPHSDNIKPKSLDEKRATINETQQ